MKVLHICSIVSVRTWVKVFFASLLCGTWFFQFSTLRQPIVEHFGFRQTQTAFQTDTLFTGEASLLHPKLPVFGFPWEVPFEMPIFQLSASWIMRAFDLPSDVASRSASLIWFSLCLVPLWLISRKFLNRQHSALVVLLFAFSPLAILYSRASLIEYCALCFSLLFVYFFIRSCDKQNFWDLALVALFGSLGAVTKSTTLISALLFVAFLHVGPVAQQLKKSRKSVLPLLITAIPVIASLIAMAWWTHHADGIKDASPATQWLTSSNLTTWNFGTFEQRQVLDNYRQILEYVNTVFVPYSIGFIVLSIPIVLQRGPRSRLLISSFTGTAATIMIFFNLYVVHDYYLVAVSPYFAFAIAIVVIEVSSVVQAQSGIMWRSVALTAFVIVFALIFSSGFWGVSRDQTVRYDSRLMEVIPPESYLFVAVNDWNPTFLYSIQRRGVMLDQRGADLPFLKELPDLDRYDFVVGPLYSLDLLGLKRYASSIETDLFRIANDLADLPRNSFAIDSASNQETLGDVLFEMVCDGSQTILPEVVPPNTRLITSSNQDQKIIFSNSSSPIPSGVTLIRTQASFDSESVGISCIGGGTLTFSKLLDNA